MEKVQGVPLGNCKVHTVRFTARSIKHRFLAFWLRSGVVSVLTSLIFDMSSIQGQYIKCIFEAGSGIVACSLHSVHGSGIAVLPGMVR